MPYFIGPRAKISECHAQNERRVNAPLSCYLIPTIDKPTRVHRSSATLIDNIFVNNPEQVSLSGNIISDISDHFSQFCLIKSTKASNISKKKKVRDFSNFSAESFRDDVCQVSWNTLTENGGNDVDKLFSSFYNKLIKLLIRMLL